jgi:hypothetical protein
MNAFLTKAVLGATLAATSLTAALPADAAPRRGRGNDGTGIAIVAGIAGLAIGAAIASGDNDRDRRRYDDRNYRDQQYNNQYNNQYNADPRYNQNYYNDNGYNYQNCRVVKRYDPYQGRKVKVRVCN